MARQYKITDGAITVDLLDITSPGIVAQRGGLGPTRHSRDLRINAGLEGQVGLAGFATDPVVENLTLNVRGSSQDNVAAQWQALMKLLRKASQYMAPGYEWQTDPVWLVAQHTNETSARYAMVLGTPSWRTPDQYATPFEVDNEWEGVRIQIIREAFFRSAAPGTVPSDLTLTHADHPDGTATKIVVPNAVELYGITHLFSYDASGADFSANRVASAAFNYLHAAALGAGDFIYFGSEDGPFHNVTISLSQGFTYTGTQDIQWEYYNGSSWVVFGTGQDDRFNDPTEFLEVPGLHGSQQEFCINWQGPPDWATVSINSVTAYWIRMNVVGVGSGNTQLAVNADINPYTSKKSYFEIGSSILSGDTTALGRIQFQSMHQNSWVDRGNGSNVSRLILGAKSRGLTNFQSNLNLGTVTSGANPAWVTLTAGTDTTLENVVPAAPGGFAAITTFVTATATRLTITTTPANLNDLEDYRGKYRVFLRVRQIGGVAGDVGVFVGIGMETSLDMWKSGPDYTYLQGVDQDPEIVSLGILDIPMGSGFGLGTMPMLDIQLSAKSINGSTPNLEWHDLILIPIDEWAVVIDDPLIPGANPSSYISNPTFESTRRTHRKVVLDGGVQTKHPAGYMTSIQQNTSGQPASPLDYYLFSWQLQGAGLNLEPGKQTRIYYLLMHRDIISAVSYTLFSFPGEALMITMQAHDRWHGPRGAD